MGLFDFLNSTSNAADKAMDGIINGGDKLFFTAEEKAEYAQKAAELWLKIQEAIREEGSIRSLTRRYIAVISTAVYLLFGITSIVVFPIDKEWSNFILKIMTGELGWMVLGINVFYFGPHMIGRMKK